MTYPQSSSARVLAYLRAAFAALVAVLILSVSTFAADDARKVFDIPEGPASSALKQFKEQSGVQLLYSSGTVRGVTTMAVKGELTAEEALRQMFAGTDLAVVQDTTNGSLTLVKSNADESKNVNRAIAQSSDRPSKNQKADNSSDTEGVVKLDTFEVFGRKTLNMDIQRTRDDVQPYVIFDRSQIERSGAANIAEFFRNRVTTQPQPLFNGTATSGNAATVSGIDLRGLGSDQTLILIDGHRAGGYAAAGSSGQPDLNGIPLSAIERIEILSSTASAIYGGGATGGVVNVILKRDYEGLTTSFRIETPLHSGGKTESFDFNAGIGFPDKGTRIRVSGSYLESDPLLVGDRSYSDDGRVRILANSPATIYPPSNPPLGTTTNIASADGSSLILKSQYGGTNLGSAITYIPAGYAGISVSGASPLLANAGHYNLGLANTAQSNGGRYESLLTGSRIKSASVDFGQDIGTNTNVFISLSSSENQSRGNRRTVITSTFTIPQAAANNPFNQNIRVTVPAFGAEDNVSSQFENQRIVTGATIRLPRDWNFGMDYIYERTTRSFSGPGTGILSAGTTAVTTGTLDVLRDVNVFPADFSPYRPISTRIDPVSTWFVNAAMRAGGPVGRLWGIPVQVSALAEWRKETLGDYYQRTNNTGGSFYPSRSQETKSAYAEIRSELLPKRKDSVDARLEVTVAGRYDQYETEGASNSVPLVNALPSGTLTRALNRFDAAKPLIGAKAELIRGLSLRTSFSLGFLPPSVSQLVPSAPIPLTGLAGVTDPLRGNEPIGPFQILTGGSPNLRPETSKSYSAGLVYKVQAFGAWRMSVDWTLIQKKDNIRAAGGLNQTTVNSESYVPGLIQRGPLEAGSPYSVGPITIINGQLINIAQAEAEAVDLAFEYLGPKSHYGRWGWNLAATCQFTNESQLTPNAPTVDNIGLFYYKWNAYSEITWEMGRFQFGWATKYYSTLYLNQAHSVNTTLGISRYPETYTHDVNITWRPHWSPMGKFQLSEVQLGVKNLFNQKSQPSEFTPFARGNVDLRGTELWGRVTLGF